MQAMHGRLGDPVSYEALQHFITDSPWEAARVWTQVRAAVPVRTGILALDDTGFPKQGTQSPGVQRQYRGALGKIGNCQAAVSSALLAAGGTWPLAFDLYLPPRWTDDPDRARAAGIPVGWLFREKWRIALAHVRTVLQAGFQLDGVAVDADYGANAAFRAALERLGLAYGVAIRGDLAMGTSEARRAYPRVGARRRGPGRRLADRHLGHRDQGAAHRRLSGASARGPRRAAASAGCCANGVPPTAPASTICSISTRPRRCAPWWRSLDGTLIEAPSSCPSRSGSPCRRHRPARRHAPPPRHWRSATCNCRP